MIRLGCLPNYVRLLLGASLLTLSPLSQADGVYDLHTALKQLQSSDPVAMDVEFRLFGRSGEGDELIDREGLINLRMEDGKQGMQVIYSPETIALLHKEELAKIADENVKNSALNAVGEFGYWEWRELLYPAAQLELALGRYHFVNEKPDVLNGQAVRCLTFQLPVERVDKSIRKYIRKYKNQLQVWINDQGIPVASKVSEKGSGRIFIVIGFKFKNETHIQYQALGKRLLAVRREVKEQGSGATMQSQRHFIATLTPVL
jgi:hypothetical protein